MKQPHTRIIGTEAQNRIPPARNLGCVAESRFAEVVRRASAVFSRCSVEITATGPFQTRRERVDERIVRTPAYGGLVGC